MLQPDGALITTHWQVCACSLANFRWVCCRQDDALDDAELNAFQVRCFNAPLQPEELMGVKKVVQDKMPQVRVR